VASARRIERRLAHEPVNACFRAQEAVRVFAFDLDRRALDAGHIALGLFEHLGLEPFALTVTQILAQQHRRPIARLGAAGPSLNIDERIVRIGRIGKHPPEFHVGNAMFERPCIGLAGDERLVVVFFARHLEKILRIAQMVIERGKGEHHAFQ
jgi:hypothetical protein